jgi:transposase
VLRVARPTAIRARTQASNASRRWWSLPRPSCASSCGTCQPPPGGSRGRPGPRPDHQPTGGGHARAGHPGPPPPGLSLESKALTAELDRLTATAAPKLVALLGIGHDHAGALLVTAGDNPQRLPSQACLAMLGGSSPIQATVRQDHPAPPPPGW